ncbi:hypothetical protein Q095_00351 [Pseudomonas aeruginosa PS50]|uniref:type II toxin-antitoxin system CcdA family antitoxin n=1 Tax=Pseudomonas aeruginosa TaxID=287 RepID=UPI0004516FF4|nr:type II toxin-antitoxin system CcdA family antitoxin [Pseudomonas aeruginosa]ETU79898.1 hypothetical protein Q095_00351 [Pseudomonas aeruginosa PS50]
MSRDKDKPSEVNTDDAVPESRQDWLKDSQKAIDYYNKRVEEHGVFSDDLRTF